jgi:asparagine synthase (glutamine-hydrolysing)
MQNVGSDPADAYYRDLCFTKPALVNRLLGRPMRASGRLAGPVYQAITDAYRRCPSPDAVQCAQYADAQIYLPNDVLVKVDRMSMLHSLEIRCPILDRRILEMAFRIPSRRKLKWPQGKLLLRAIAARRLSTATATRRKRGFDAPLQEWTRSEYSTQVERDLLGGTSIVRTLFDPAIIRQVFNEHRQGARDHSHVLWTMWMLEWWYRVRRRPAEQVAPAGATAPLPGSWRTTPSVTPQLAPTGTNS